MVLLVLVIFACFCGFGGFWLGRPGALPTIPFDFYQIWWFLMVLVVLLVLVVLVVLVVSHCMVKEPSTIFFDFHQISTNFPSVHLIIFSFMSSDFLGLSSRFHTSAITAKTVLPGIFGATPRLAATHAPSSTPRHASHHARP